MPDIGDLGRACLPENSQAVIVYGHILGSAVAIVAWSLAAYKIAKGRITGTAIWRHRWEWERVGVALVAC